MASHYKLLSSKQYIRTLINKINNATTRISMIAFVISEDTATREVLQALTEAAKRGVEVHIAMDLYFSYIELEHTAPKWHYLQKQVSAMHKTKRKLEQSGAKVRWLGSFGSMMFFHRTHTKWSVVDDHVFTFGGVNLYHDGIQNVDYMLYRHDPELARKLHSEHDAILRSDRAEQGYKSHSFTHDGDTVLIDGGRANDSIIFRRAKELTRQATHVTLVSQYCPSGEMARLIRNVDHTLYFNSWKSAHSFPNRSYLKLSSAVHRMESRYKRNPYLHAKFMLFTMPDGSEIAITGSHNFVAFSSRLGTREIALETTNPSVIEQLHTFIDKRLES